MLEHELEMTINIEERYSPASHVWLYSFIVISILSRTSAVKYVRYDSSKQYFFVHWYIDRLIFIDGRKYV